MSMVGTIIRIREASAQSLTFPLPVAVASITIEAIASTMTATDYHGDGYLPEHFSLVDLMGDGVPFPEGRLREIVAMGLILA